MYECSAVLTAVDSELQAAAAGYVTIGSVPRAWMNCETVN
jgi:hypothetical protein